MNQKGCLSAERRKAAKRGVGGCDAKEDKV